MASVVSSGTRAYKGRKSEAAYLPRCPHRVSKAWESVSENIIRESFVICGITTAIDGSQNEKIFNHIPRVLAEEIEEEEDDSENESPEDFVEGDDFDPFEDL